MKLGLQTLGWGTNVEALAASSECAADMGCDGIEIGQPLNALGKAEYISQTVQGHGLRIAGLAGGALRSRMDRVGSLRPEYLYVDEWDQTAVLDAMSRGLTVALHPHYYKRIDTIKSARYYLDKFPKLGLILDPAHQYLCDDDALQALKTFQRRVVSIHLKDWQPNHGRSPQLFGRGFTYLGNGILKRHLKELVAYALRIQYSGWLIIDHESPPRDPCEYARRSREWLRSMEI